MTDQLISLETAKLAYEKGFIEHQGRKGYYRLSDGREVLFNIIGKMEDEFLGHAPAQSLLQKWLREEHGLDIVIDSCWYNLKKTRKEYIPWILDRPDEQVEDEEPEYYPTYEEALESALQDALKLI